jgi:DNA-binding NarL/FixJ family response regulator
MISDINMSGVSGLDLIRHVLNQTPETVVVLICTRRTIDAAIQAMPEAAQGETCLSPPIPNFTTRECCSRIDAAGFPLEKLTARQTQVLRLIAEGKTTKEVALELNISVKTVETHRTQLMDRLEIHDIAGLVRFAIKVGLVRLED